MEECNFLSKTEKKYFTLGHIVSLLLIFFFEFFFCLLKASFRPFFATILWYFKLQTLCRNGTQIRIDIE